MKENDQSIRDNSRILAFLIIYTWINKRLDETNGFSSNTIPKGEEYKMTKNIIQSIQEILTPGPVSKRMTLTPFIIEYDNRAKQFMISRKGHNVMLLTSKYKHPEPETGFRIEHERVLSLKNTDAEGLNKAIETFPALPKTIKDKLMGEMNKENIGWLANILVKSNPKISEELNELRYKGLSYLLRLTDGDFIDIYHVEDPENDFDTDMRHFLEYLRDNMSNNQSLSFIIREYDGTQKLNLHIRKLGKTDYSVEEGTAGSFSSDRLTPVLDYLNKMTILYKFIKEDSFDKFIDGIVPYEDKLVEDGNRTYTLSYNLLQEYKQFRSTQKASK